MSRGWPSSRRRRNRRTKERAAVRGPPLRFALFKGPSQYGSLRLHIDQLAARTGCRPRLEVDGGIKLDNVARVAEVGADTFVAGSAVFGAPDYRDVIDGLRDRADIARAGARESGMTRL